MATKLEKNLTRESSIDINGRNIQVTITKEQTISMKLKGMKSGDVEISIEELYQQLTDDTPDSEPEKINRKKKINEVDESLPLINLYDFRSQYIIHNDIPLETKVKLEGITVNLINNLKK